MMHKRFTSGFTLIELMVVIVVITVLATVSLLSYQVVSKSSHDSKRQNDMQAFAHELEKYYAANGEYPPGCVEVDPCQDITASNLKNGDGSMFNTSSSPQINASTTLTQIQQILPGLTSNFGDPVNVSTNPITNSIRGTTDPYKYLYSGGFVNNNSDGQPHTYTMSWSNPNGTGYSPFACAVQVQLTSGQRSGYIIGYYNEEDSKWHLQRGKHEVENYLLLDFSGHNQTQPTCWGSTQAVFDN